MGVYNGYFINIMLLLIIATVSCTNKEYVTINNADGEEALKLYIECSGNGDTIVKLPERVKELMSLGPDYELFNYAEYKKCGASPKYITYLQISAYLGYIETVKAFIKKGANINNECDIYIEKNDKEQEGGILLMAKPIHLAAYTGKIDVVKWFVENGVNVNVKNKTGMKPLHFAAWGGCAYMVKYLIMKGTDINEKDELGYTPIHYATSQCKESVVELLVLNGANINSKNKYGKIALHYAVENNSLKITEHLVRNGSDINTIFIEENSYEVEREHAITGKTPLDIAIIKGYKEIEIFLRKQGAKTAEEIMNK